MTRSMIDPLEQRRLLAASLLRVGTVTADNRGEVIIRFSEAATGVRGGAGQMYTAGPDGKLFTSDDKKENPRVTYSTNKKQMTIKGNLPPNTPYRIKLDGKTRIRSAATGQLMDGNFNDAYHASGDGKAGGNFEFSTNANTSKTRSIKMRTNYGDIIIRLREDVAPVSAGKFSDLLDAGKYDKAVIYRKATGFVLQLGSLQLTGDGLQTSDVVENTDAPEFPQELPRVLSNVRGTLSFARGGAQSLASNQFFFNLGDNNTDSAPNNLDTSSGSGDPVFTPFAEVTQGQSVVDTIAALPSYNLGNTLGPYQATGVSDVPVKATITDNQLIPVRDLVLIERAGEMMIITGK